MTIENSKKLFGQNMKEIRQEKGISQEKLAFDAGLDRTYISGVERGKRNISLINIIKISESLNVNIKDLFKWHHL